MHASMHNMQARMSCLHACHVEAHIMHACVQSMCAYIFSRFRQLQQPQYHLGALPPDIPLGVLAPMNPAEAAPAPPAEISCMHALRSYHACMPAYFACMHIMHACKSCTHAHFACTSCMHGMHKRQIVHACVQRMHACRSCSSGGSSRANTTGMCCAPRPPASRAPRPWPSRGSSSSSITPCFQFNFNIKVGL